MIPFLSKTVNTAKARVFFAFLCRKAHPLCAAVRLSAAGAEKSRTFRKAFVDSEKVFFHPFESGPAVLACSRHEDGLRLFADFAAVAMHGSRQPVFLLYSDPPNHLQMLSICIYRTAYLPEIALKRKPSASASKAQKGKSRRSTGGFCLLLMKAYFWAAALVPASLPVVMHSEIAFPPRRLPPWNPPVTSPAA